MSSNDYNFNFDLVSEKELKKNEELAHQKLLQLREMIMPLLHNLSKDPDKTYIYWENRVPQVLDFIDKINKHVDE